MTSNSVEVIEWEVDLAGERPTRAIATVKRLPGWLFVLTFAPTGEFGGFEVRRQDGGAVVTRRLLRDIPLGELEHAARMKFAPLADAVAAIPSDDVHELARDWYLRAVTASGALRRPGRRGRVDHYYAALAAMYVDLVQRGSSRPNVELAETLCVNTQTVTNQLYEARKRGLLTQAAQGRAGGELTDKARQILLEHE
jgi:hypothetical protein